LPGPIAQGTDHEICRNSSNLGQFANAGYKALWDADHPDDPLEFPGALGAAGTVGTAEDAA